MDIQLVQETCCSCKIPFWIIAQHQERLRSEKTSFYCPSGHSQSYTGRSDKAEKEEAEKKLAEQVKYSQQLQRIIEEKDAQIKEIRRKKKKAI